MANCIQPIRTYQRKTAKKSLINVSPASSIISNQKYQDNFFNNNKTCNNSITHHLFETTFDRIAKGAVVPPLPLDLNQNDSWNSSNSSSDVNNETNLVKSEYMPHNLFTYNNVSGLTKEKIKRECRKLHKYKMEAILEPRSKRTKVISTKNDKLKAKKQAQKVQLNVQRQEITQHKLKKSSHKFNKRVCRSSTTSDLENAAHKDIKPSSVVLYDIFKNCKEKDKKSIVSSTDAVNKTDTLHLVFGHNLSNTVFPYDINIDNTISDRDENNACLIKESFINMERLKREKLVEKKVTDLDKKEKYVISSTPIGKHIRSSTYSIVLSPIQNIRALNSRYENSTGLIVEENIPIDIFPEQKDSVHLSITSECHKSNITDMEEQQAQILLPSQKLSMATDLAKVETKSFNKDVHSILTQSYNAKSDIKMELPHSLNISAGTDRSRSLFGDTIHNSDHLTKEIIGNNVEKKCIMDALENKSPKISCTAVSLHLSTDSNLKQKKELLVNNIYTDISSACITSYKIPSPIKKETSEDLNDIGYLRQGYKGQEKRNTKMSPIEIICKSSKNETVNDSEDSSFSKSQDKLSINIIDNYALFTKLQNTTKITKRIQYSRWHPSVSSTSKSLNRSTLSNNEVLHYIAADDCSNIPSITNNLDHSKNAINSSLDYFKSHDDATQRHSNETNIPARRSVFLKSGKCWARSLSILSNINPESDLDKLCTGKGRKWRHSVRDILDMQKQGLNTSIVSSLGDNRYKAFDSTNGRLSKRISVRVVPNNNTSIECNVKDVPFLEAFGITARNSSLKLETLPEEELSIHNVEYNGKVQIFDTHPITAKDVILQRCSQEQYLPFSKCFPDSYLEHCRKIGEGVYGEVFLYERDDEISVIKIIPIEGKELVNGETQKKFSEILSEIVIAEELHNLRLHSKYRTNAFVEVRSIRCIMGKYPEKLVKLWKIYDDDKTSDNDCPSMFGEHQLYIALELGHGGEDLEAFVFQTAKEAYALFLQTALALAVAEKAFEFEHRDLHWGNVLISRTKESYMYYNLDGKEIKFPSNNVKVSIIDYTLSRMLYQGYCIYNDLALDPALFTARGEYQFEIYRLMREKIQNNWQKFEPYTNVLWLHYVLDKMITAVRYKRKNLKAHRQAINKLKELKNIILNYDSAYNFVNDSNSVMQYMLL